MCEVLVMMAFLVDIAESANFERQAPAGPYSYVSLHRAQSNTAPMHPGKQKQLVKVCVQKVPYSIESQGVGGGTLLYLKSA